MAKTKADKWKTRWSVQSRTDRNVSYTVAVDWDGKYGCSCPRWRFNRKEEPICKHIHYVLRQSTSEKDRMLISTWSGELLLPVDWDLAIIEDNTGNRIAVNTLFYGERE